MIHLKTLVIVLVLCCCIALTLLVSRSSSSSSSSQNSLQKSTIPASSSKSKEKFSTDEVEKAITGNNNNNNNNVVFDMSQHLPFVIPLSSDEDSQSASHYYSAPSVVKTIQTHLFKNFVKGHFEFEKNSQKFSSRTTEFKSNSQESSRDTKNVFDFGWQPTSCLPKSTLKCSRLKNMGGPLKSLSPFLNFDDDNSKNNSRVSGYCCGFAETGIWTKSFSPDAFEEFRSIKIDVASLIFNRLIWEDKLEKLGIDPRKIKSGFVNNNNNNNNKIIGAKSNQEQLEDEIKQRLSKMGESAQSQQLLEELYTVLGRNFATNTANDKLTLDQTRMMLFAAISGMKLVDVDVDVPASSNTSSDNISKNDYYSSTHLHHNNQNEQFTLRKQKAVRIFITGNSYLRALISNIGAIMRNQERYFDRGTHSTIRYVFTNLGDYYWFDPSDNVIGRSASPTVQQQTKSTFKKEKVSNRNNNNNNNYSDSPTPKPKKPSSTVFLPPIILRSDKEVVFFEIVYNFQTGMHIANHEYSKKRAQLSSMDYNLESPLMSLSDQRRMFRGKFSGIFMRPFAIHSSGAFFKFYRDRGFEEYAKWQMETVMKYDDDADENNNNYLVAMHSSHPLQYLWVDQSRNSPYAKYELIHSKAAFEEARNVKGEQNISFASRRRHVFVPFPGSTKTRERVTITDDLSHSNCILLPHFPFPTNGLRHQELEVKDNSTNFNYNKQNNKINSNNENQINVKDCRDMLSRNYWFRFGFDALLSAPWVKKQFGHG